MDMRVDHSVGKKRLSDTKKESQVTYTDVHYSEVFDQIEAHDQWVHSIRFYSKQREREQNGRRLDFFSGLITRSCFFSIRRNFVPLIKIIIPSAIKFASVRNEYLRLREEKASKLKPEPIVIKFEDKPFSDTSKNKQFIGALSAMDSCSISRYHNNPYIHLSLIDYLDGSSYDIWVVTVDRMVIIPSFSASTASMSRLLNHVFERIKEGEIEDYEQAKIATRS
jgi:hypothetical protein